MPNLNTSIIANHDQQSQSDNGFVQNDSTVINECRSIISMDMSELLPLFFSQLDDDLFRLSEKAETNAVQTILFEAMRFVRRERTSMQTKFMEGLTKEYDSYWKKPLKNLRMIDGGGVLEEDGLTLIEESVLEESLAVTGMIEKGSVMYQPQLFPLNERFCALTGNNIESEKLPVSPHVICKLFSSILDPLEIELKVKLIIYKIFERQILAKLGNVYDHLNAHLAAKGILPSISSKIVKQNSRVSPDQTEREVKAPTSEEVIELTTYLETFRTMQSLMDNWRQQMGMSALSSAALSGVPIADTEEVIDFIDLLQRSSQGESESDQPISAENLKQQVAIKLGKVQGNKLGRTIGRPEEDTIDMVGMIFDYILDDKDMPAPIRCSISRLQIPIIKVAILDKTFFAKKSHPSRVLLNDLAQAGIGLTSEDVSSENPIIYKIEEIVGRVINEFSQNISLFDDLLKEFSEFMEKEAKRSMLSENRTLQTTQSKEKIWMAKKAVASVITLRLQDKDTPVSFRNFIYNDWKDVLFIAYLRKDKNEAEWKLALDIFDKMIWSITPPINAQERTKLIREIPGIVKAIREGLESTNLDAHQIASLLKDLETCHMNALRPNPAQNKLTEDANEGNASAAQTLPIEVNIKDPELAEAILEIKSLLPDISDIDVEEVIMGGMEPISQKEASGWLRDFVPDKYTEEAKRLKVGDWLEFMNDDGKSGRAKLAWKSPSTSLCVFVNRRGIKVLELKLNDLAVRMRQGRANVIASTNIPLMDRAVSFLTKSLQNPFAKPEPSTLYA